MSLRSDALDADLPIWIPNDYAPNERWPVLVYFHGTGGEPNWGPVVEATGGQQFIVVGAGYVQRGLFRAEPKALAAEWSHTKTLLDALGKRVSLNPDRVYVGGFSKGGWVASMILETYPNEIAGAWICGAGKLRLKTLPSRRTHQNKPVYLGVGATDPNRIASLEARRDFAKARMRVTYDEYEGLGHSYEVTQSMRDWFRIETLGAKTPAADPPITAQAATELDAVLALAQTVLTPADDAPLDDAPPDDPQAATPWQVWCLLRDAQRGPWYASAQPAKRKQVDDAFKLVSKLPELKSEVRAWGLYEVVLRREVAQRSKTAKARTMEAARKKAMARKRALLDGYANVVNRHPNTHYGRRAEVDQRRIASHLKQM